MKKLLLLSVGAALTLASCSDNKSSAVERAEDMAPGTTVKGADGSKIKKQEDGDIKIKDAQGNVVKKDADDGTTKVKTE